MSTDDRAVIITCRRKACKFWCELNRCEADMCVLDDFGTCVVFKLREKA